MKWHKSMQHVKGDEPPLIVHWTSEGPLPYRVYGRWDAAAKRVLYRVEYKLDTGWWAVGQRTKFREAQSLAEADALRWPAQTP